MKEVRKSGKTANQGMKKRMNSVMRAHPAINGKPSGASLNMLSETGNG
jgi:hypothetical protein